MQEQGKRHQPELDADTFIWHCAICGRQLDALEVSGHRPSTPCEGRK
jgi:hypothetical protein